MRLFGLHFSMAYQLLDDWLDYNGDSVSMGKNVGDDLAEGKLTLPLIHALQHSNHVDKVVIQHALQSRNLATLPNVLKIVRASGSLDYTRARAQQQIENAIDCLEQIPSNDHHKALIDLSHYSLSRLG